MHRWAAVVVCWSVVLPCSAALGAQAASTTLNVGVVRRSIEFRRQVGLPAPAARIRAMAAGRSPGSSWKYGVPLTPREQGFVERRIGRQRHVARLQALARRRWPGVFAG